MCEGRGACGAHGYLLGWVVKSGAKETVQRVGHLGLGCNIDKYGFMDMYVGIEKNPGGETPVTWYPSKCQLDGRLQN